MSEAPQGARFLGGFAVPAVRVPPHRLVVLVLEVGLLRQASLYGAVEGYFKSRVWMCHGGVDTRVCVCVRV